MANPVRELSPDTLVLHCVDLRRRLRQTEKSLQGLTALEQGISGTQPDQNEIRRLVQRSADASQATSPGTVPILTMDDLSPRNFDLSPRNLDPQVLEQGLNTSQVTSSLGSLRALRTPAALPSSTPKYQTSQPRRYDLDGSRGSYRADSISPSMVQEEILRLQEERRLFKEEIVLLRDENSQLLSRNQALVHDIENGKLDTKRLGEKLRLLSGELGKYRAAFPDLEEKVISLTSETAAQDTALRNAEVRCERAQKELAEAVGKLARVQTEYDNSSKEMTEEKKLRKRLELQRDAAVEELNQLQGLLNAYQRKSKDKIASLEKREDRLQDDLSQANQEREELQEKSSLLQEQVYDLEEELRLLREQTGVDEDTKADLETENCGLQAKLKELEQQIELFRCAVSEKADLEQENASLRSRVETQAEQLSRCQGEITDSRVMLEQLERLVEQVQTKSFTRTNSTNDSGVGSIDSARGRSAQLSMDGHTSGAPADQSDVRKLLSMKEAENQQLQANLQALVGGSQTTQKTSSIVENLRSELLATIEKQKLCERKSRELETMLCELEAERNRLRSEISDIRSESTGRDAICLSLESRLKQRENQLAELQDEISLKSSTIHNMERELRKKSAQMTSLEEQLDEKVGEFTMHMTRLKLQEDDVAAKMEEIQALRAELNQRDKQLRDYASAGETLKRVQQEQFQEFEKQIDMLQEELEKRMQENVEKSSELQRLTAELEAKSMHLIRIENQLTSTKQELDVKREEEKKSLAHLESQTTLATNQIKQLETALVVCREEMGTYVKQLDESKEQFEKTVNDKNKQISVLDRQLKEAYLETEQKDQEITELGRSVREQQAMLTQGNRRVGELEDSQSQLEEQVSSLEQKLLQEKGQWLEESRGLERKLHNACVELETRAAQMSDLTEALRLVQEDKATLEKELKSLDKELIEAQNINDRISQKLTQLEKENRDLRVMVEQKTEMVQDLEDQVRQQGETMERQNRKLEDRENQMEDVKAEVKLHKVRSAELRDQLQQSQFDCKAKEQMLDDLQESLRRGQEVLAESQERVRELEKALEDRLWELHQRASQVSKLENTMKEYQESVEQSAANQKAEMDKMKTNLQDRTKQLSDVDDKLEVAQKQLREVTLQFEQAQQTIGRLESELKNKANEMIAKEEEIESFRRIEKGQKEDMAEITQELRLAREQLQQRHSELSGLKQDLRETERERDKLSRDLERITDNTQNATVTLQREVDVLREREKMLELRLSSETSRHEQEVERMSQLQHDEITKLQESYASVLARNEQLSAQSRLQQKNLEEKSRLTETDMITAKALVKQLQEEIQAKNTLLDSVHETVVLKDAEIARLHAKVSRFERDVGMRAAEQWMSQRDSVNSSQYSDALIGQSLQSSSKYGQNDGSGNWTMSNNGVVQDQVDRGFDAQNDRIPLPRVQQAPNMGANSSTSKILPVHHSIESDKLFKNPQLQTDRQNSSFPYDNRVGGLVPKSWQRRGCDSGMLFETSDTDSDRETCRRIAEISSDSDQGNTRVAYQDTRARILVSSPKSQDVARTLDFDDSGAENSNNSNVMSHIPVRDSEKTVTNSQAQGNGRVLPLRSAIKTSKVGVKSVNFSNKIYQPSQTSARQSKSQIQQNSKVKKPSENTGMSQQGRSFAEPDTKRQSSNFAVHDFENTVTAVQQYRSPVGRKSSPDTSAIFPTMSVVTADEDAALSVEDLQERLRANKLKQEEIDRQLLSLESEFEVSQDVDISQ